MPMWARAIIFGIELVGFIILSIYAIKKFYENGKQENLTSKEIKGDLKFNIIFCSVIFAVILALFLFAFPSYVFFSYNKLLLVSVVELVFVSLMLWVLTGISNIRFVFMYLFVLSSISTLVLSGMMSTGAVRIENKVAVSEHSLEKKVISPTMFSENQIGYTADLEGNIKTYVFYYMDNGIWNQKEVKASETKVERIKDADTYIEKTVTTTSYCKQEKKHSEADYIYSEENEKYVIYLNLKQMVEVKID